MIALQRSNEKFIDPRNITKPSNYTLNMQYQSLQTSIEQAINDATKPMEAKEGIQILSPMSDSLSNADLMSVGQFKQCLMNLKYLPTLKRIERIHGAKNFEKIVKNTCIK